MKTLSFDCGMGAAGDMLAAALYELLPEQTKIDFLKSMNALLPSVSVQIDPAKKCGIVGTKFTVLIDGQVECVSEPIGSPSCKQSIHAVDELPHDHEHHHDHGQHDHEHHDCKHYDHKHHDHEHHDHEHAHHLMHEHHHGRSMTEVDQVIASLPIPHSVRTHAQAVYRLLADAESLVHGTTVEQIHFHEVGTLDAIMDIVAVCLLIDLLQPDQVYCSPVHVGAGQVRCAHGLLPVPAPATAQLLKGVPIYSGTIRGELCTPTGAALLKHFCSFERQPVLIPQAIGYGMGTKDFEAANCVRVLFGESNDAQETILELSCNLDDMTPEAIGFAVDRLWESPVLDVFTSPIGMKKNRPATMLTCLCQTSDAPEIIRLLFRHTTTLGIRQHVCSRYTLQRAVREVSLDGELLRVKRTSGWGVLREKAEYEDAARFARANGLSFAEASDRLLRAAREQLMTEPTVKKVERN